MQLIDYLQREGLTFAAFGRQIGTPHARTVERYAKRQQRPSGEMMARIVRATSGDVQPNDFFEAQ